LGLRPAQVSKCERDVQLPKAEMLPQLSQVLGVSIDYLLTGRSFGEPQRDYRLRERLDDLESFPEPQRNHLVEFLDALISAHQVLRKYGAMAGGERGGDKPERERRAGAGARR
jgi:transcriptional regulator with XRE-family HTH domain